MPGARVINLFDAGGGRTKLVERPMTEGLLHGPEEFFRALNSALIGIAELVETEKIPLTPEKLSILDVGLSAMAHETPGELLMDGKSIWSVGLEIPIPAVPVIVEVFGLASVEMTSMPNRVKAIREFGTRLCECFELAVKDRKLKQEFLKVCADAPRWEGVFLLQPCG